MEVKFPATLTPLQTYSPLSERSALIEVMVPQIKGVESDEMLMLMRRFSLGLIREPLWYHSMEGMG